jgi:hypothetical protein
VDKERCSENTCKHGHCFVTGGEQQSHQLGLISHFGDKNEKCCDPKSSHPFTMVPWLLFSIPPIRQPRPLLSPAFLLAIA